jgi:transposase
MARPIELTPKIQETICACLRRGHYMETAAAQAGIAKQTLFVWLRRGARGEGEIFENFAKAVHKASADAEVAMLARIEAAGEKWWQADAWRLERRFPHKWAQRRELTKLEKDRIKADIELTKARTKALKDANNPELATETIDNPEAIRARIEKLVLQEFKRDPRRFVEAAPEAIKMLTGAKGDDDGE